MKDELRKRVEEWKNCEHAMGLRDMELFAMDLIAALKAADPVAEAVKWCEKHDAYVRRYRTGEGQRMSVWRITSTDGGIGVNEPSLPVAVAALQKRGEGGAQ